MSKNFGFNEAEIYRGMYEKYKDDPEVDTEDLKRKAQVFDLFGQALDIDQNATLQIMDTGIMNEPIEAYFTVAMHRAGLDQDTQRAVMDCLRSVLDDYTAGEVLKVARRI